MRFLPPAPRPLPPGLLLPAAGILLVVTAALAWSGASDGRMHVIVPAIGGDGLLIKSPGGRVALIDGGADGTAVASWLGRELPLGRREIDLLVGTRADDTTLPGQLAAARRYRIRSTLLVEPAAQHGAWEALLSLLKEQGTAVRFAQGGDRLRLDGPDGKELWIEVLSAADHRALLALTSRETRLLLLQSLLDEPLPPAVGRLPTAAIVYPWRRSTNDPALQALAPQVVIFGERPGVDPRMTLAERGVGPAQLLHEALHGRIDLAFDGQGVHIGLERRPGK